MRFAALAVVAALGLGAVIVVASGWGGLYLYAYGIGFAVLFLALVRYGGTWIEDWSRSRFRYRDRNRP
jgi:hypothetical protein